MVSFVICARLVMAFASTRTNLIYPPSLGGLSAVATRRFHSVENSEEENQALVVDKVTNTTVAALTNLGAPGGPTICNKDTIFQEIDEALGVGKPPDVEVILTDHLCYIANPFSKFLHLHILRFGHIAIRYTTSDGISRVMNILGDLDQPDARMINFVSPADYFYGTRGFTSFAQQGGVYNRPFVGVRIENVAKGATDAMHKYFEALAAASEIGELRTGRPGSSDRGAVRFQLVELQLSKVARAVPAPFDKVFYRAADVFRNLHDLTKKTRKGNHPLPETNVRKSVVDARQTIYNSGNCAQFTSGGLDFVGLIRRARLFPKAILIDLLEEEVLKFRRRKNVNVVYYCEVEHAKKRHKDYRFLKPAMVHPLNPLRNAFYHNMKDFASAVVTVPIGTDRAIVESRVPTRRPRRWLSIITGIVFYLPAAVMVGLVKQIGPLGPTGAAVWLFANWWLY
jgi:hypothetical protein